MAQVVGSLSCITGVWTEFLGSWLQLGLPWLLWALREVKLKTGSQEKLSWHMAIPNEATT